MGSKALGAAGGAASGGAAGGGAPAGGGVYITLMLPPGATPADAAKMKAEIDKGLPGWLAMSRRAGRDGQEGAA